MALSQLAITSPAIISIERISLSSGVVSGRTDPFEAGRRCDKHLFRNGACSADQSPKAHQPLLKAMLGLAGKQLTAIQAFHDVAKHCG